MQVQKYENEVRDQIQRARAALALHRREFSVSQQQMQEFQVDILKCQRCLVPLEEEFIHNEWN